MISGKYKIRSHEGDIEPHEVFLDTLAKTKEEEWGITQKRFELPIHEKLAYSIFAIFILVVGVLLFKVFYLQVIQGKQMALMSQNNFDRTKYSQAQRGVVYDKNLKQLVSNVSAFDLIYDKRNLFALSENPEQILQEAARITGQDYLQLEKNARDDKNPQVLIAQNLPHETIVLLESKIKDWPGFEIVNNTVRNYDSGSFFSHLMGYVGKVSQNELKIFDNYSVSDYIGKSGIEKTYETVLRGQPGKTIIKKDAMGKLISQNDESQPIDGQGIVLNLDFDLQKQLMTTLQERMKSMNLRKAAAIAMDPNTGGILAMVSTPTFDNNVFSGKISATDYQAIQQDSGLPFLNRAIAGQYPPGSTIKPLIASGILQEKIISPETKIIDKGYIEVKNQYDPSIVYRYSGLEAPGLYDIRTAISMSSNIYFYVLGGGYRGQEGLGPQRIKTYLDLFGLGSQTNIDLPGEENGFIPSVEWKKQTYGQGWQDGDTYHLAIGQGGLIVTPLQMAVAYSAIANGGTLYRPEVVKEIVNTSGGKIKTVKKIEPIIIRENFIDAINLKIVREGMRQGVLSGTGQVLQSVPVACASKTGTAQTSKGDNVYDIWASVFCPYNNPQIVITILIEDVEGLHVPALMVARDTLRWYFAQH